jgi:multidrug efflux pump
MLLYRHFSKTYCRKGALPAVRVAVNPTILHSYGLSLEDVRAALSGANANRPKGEIANNGRAWTLNTTDQLLQAADYQPVIVSYRQGAAVRLADIADVVDASEDIRNTGLVNGTPAILLIVWRQPGANIIATVDRVRAIVPQLQAEIPPTVQLLTVLDRTTSIRASVHDVQRTLGFSILLVILVVFVFSGMCAPLSSRVWWCPCRSSAPSVLCISSATVSTTCRSWR